MGIRTMKVTGLEILRCSYFVLPILLGSIAETVFAGQSITLSNATVTNPSVPAQAVNSSCRAEVSFHDWDSNPPPASHPWDAGACGLSFTIYNFGNGDVRLQIYSTQARGGQVCMISLGVDATRNPILPSKFATVRFQRVPTVSTDAFQLAASGNGGVEECEATDVNGRTFSTQSHVYTGTSGTSFNGASVGGAGFNVSTAYFRLFTKTVPLGSRPPVTADTGDLLEWKFDGNLNDLSGHGYNGQISGVSPVYVPTPGQNLVVANLQVVGAPSWSPWISMRAGYPNQLDCSGSYSQADASATVSCDWILANGPTAPSWSSTSVQQPMVTGIAFGTYNFQLTVTDATGATAVTTLPVGAVAYDDNGVVIPSDPRATELFGPMIAFGQNPWGYADERSKRAVELQNTLFLSQHLDHPTWATNGQGTVSYPFAGKGPGPGISCTSLTGNIDPTSTSLDVANASCLSLDNLPTWILAGNSIGSQEMIRICSASSATGPATLTVCYDGRGIASYPFGSNGVVAAQSWPSGTIVGEYRIAGSGTLFATDANRPVCPAGVPGPPGPVIYSSGTVSVSGGSAILTGNGTAWTVANNVIAPYMIRVAATHSGGIPFVWWAQISTVTDPTHITASRPLPSDVDAGPFNYTITSGLYLSLEATAPDGSTVRTLQNLMGCESETAAFATSAHDIPVFDHMAFSGVHYSYKKSLGIQSAFGPNFYGSGLAARAFYLRSGWDFAKQTADLIDEQWVNDPELCNGWCGGIPLLQGGGVYGAIADLVTNPSTSLSWSNVRQFAVNGSIGASGCNDFDTRDSGYLATWVALAANYDPDDAQRSIWKTRLAALYARDEKCKQTDNSWSNGFLFNTSSSPALTVTQGSTIVTGNNIPSSMCFGVASGTVTVFQGLPFLFGQNLRTGNKIVISGTREGSPYVGTFQFKEAGGVLGTLAALWPGDSGVFPYVIENNDYLSTIAMSSNDPQLTKNWACTWNNPSQVTLNRPWDGPTESNAYLYSYVLSGFGQQPYMLGIKLTQMKLGSQNGDSAIAAGYAALAPLAASWVHDIGFDPITQGMNYGRGFEACEPSSVATPGTVFGTRTPGCNLGLDPASLRAARVLSAETSQALRVYFEANPSQERKDWGDQVYGSIWGYCPYTKAGYYCDNNYVRDENSDASLASYKWPGFFFGMGMAHQWPAVRANSLTRGNN
jgi:hypothetical protein